MNGDSFANNLVTSVFGVDRTNILKVSVNESGYQISPVLCIYAVGLF